VYGLVPPLGAVPAIPSHAPKHVSLVCEVGTTRAAGSVIVAGAVAVQPFGLVTVMVYDPANSLNAFEACVVVPLLYVDAPVAFTVIVPSPKPKQLTLAVVIELITTSSTVTVAVIGLPVHVAVAGVMVYVTVPVGGVVVVNVCEMVAPVAADAPVALVELAVQLKVVPATVDVKAIVEAVPLHMVDVAGVAVTSGVAFTVMLVD
jgi:hypothetical protein